MRVGPHSEIRYHNLSDTFQSNFPDFNSTDALVLEFYICSKYPDSHSHVCMLTR